MLYIYILKQLVVTPRALCPHARERPDPGESIVDNGRKQNGIYKECCRLIYELTNGLYVSNGLYTVT